MLDPHRLDRDRDIYRKRMLGVSTNDIARQFHLSERQVRLIFEKQDAIEFGKKLKAKVVQFPGRIDERT